MGKCTILFFFPVVSWGTAAEKSHKPKKQNIFSLLVFCFFVCLFLKNKASKLTKMNSWCNILARSDWLHSDLLVSDVLKDCSDGSNRCCELQRHDGKLHDCICSMDPLWWHSRTYQSSNSVELNGPPSWTLGVWVSWTVKSRCILFSQSPPTTPPPPNCWSLHMFESTQTWHNCPFLSPPTPPPPLRRHSP